MPASSGGSSSAVMSIGSELELQTVLRRIVTAATELVNASYGALGVLDEGGTGLAEFVTVGLTPEEVRRIGPYPHGHGILGVLIVEPAPLRLPDLRKHPDSYGFPPGHPEMRSFLGVPVQVRDRVFGNLYLTDKRGEEPFTDADEELLVALAAAAGVAIENSRLHTQLADVALLEERERIARDLHDTVIQRLFASALMLQGAHRLARVPEVESRIQQAIDDIDDVIRDIRTTIFELQGAGGTAPSLRRRVLEVCAEAARPLGFEPAVRFDGPIETLVDEQARQQAVFVLREALANVARHAHATGVTVTLTASVDDSRLILAVADDGIGIVDSDHHPGYGLGNMESRAARLGGTLSIITGPGQGTTVRLDLPLAGPP